MRQDVEGERPADARRIVVGGQHALRIPALVGADHEGGAARPAESAAHVLEKLNDTGGSVLTDRAARQEPDRLGFLERFRHRQGLQEIRHEGFHPDPRMSHLHARADRTEHGGRNVDGDIGAKMAVDDIEQRDRLGLIARPEFHQCPPAPGVDGHGGDDVGRALPEQFFLRASQIILGELGDPLKQLGAGRVVEQLRRQRFLVRREPQENFRRCAGVGGIVHGHPRGRNQSQDRMYYAP